MKIISNIKHNEPKLYTIDQIVKMNGVYRVHGNEYPGLYFIVSNGYIITNDYSPIKIVTHQDEGWEKLTFYKTDDEIVLTFKNK